MASVIPDKLYFKIGEVSSITGVKPYVLRYWEKEFPSIRPQKTKTNQRVYQHKDVEAILLVKNLLYDYKYTIAGAREKLKELRSNPEEREKLLSGTAETPEETPAASIDNIAWKEALTSWKHTLNRVRQSLKN